MQQKFSRGALGRRVWPIVLGAVVAIAAVTGGLAAWASSRTGASSSDKLDNPIDFGLALALRKVGQASLAHQAAPRKNPLQAISGRAIGSKKKPSVLYIGADYCPYCASLRWPLIIALQRFGRFDGLRYMRSSSGDVYPNTITFSFHGATYHSDYIGFQSVEIADRQQQPLEKPNDAQEAVLRKFDAEPYTTMPGSIPFLYIGGRYVASGGPFDPDLLKGLSWTQAANKLQHQNAPLTQQVLGIANLYVAALCKLTKGKPARVCGTAAINAASANLPGA